LHHKAVSHAAEDTSASGEDTANETEEPATNLNTKKDAELKGKVKSKANKEESAVSSPVVPHKKKSKMKQKAVLQKKRHMIQMMKN
jgi:hypothetical protein